ncbi:arrestin domain-containing protein 17 isoform X2 [Rhipicephalus sanguineus]|uniref:arrestin domain-containing protein 17 isoform X2 n=1 Tax=Rhipicephalus sanguineus TaxID=34632 RepID=UPI0020C482B1|nr:arrestin domain-containing protein 17 isoform X2 [Rhipicephalus sanguineus]
MSRKLQKFLVLLDNETLLYFPGSFLSGKVVVELDEEIPVTGLYFHIVGEGVVRLTDKSKVNTSDRENYIDFRMRLLGENTPKGSPARVVFLSPGVHSFPFKLGLPLGLPSTFLGKHGWVQYFCKAALKEPSGLTHKNQQVFIVMSPIDLNLEPNLLTTIQYTAKNKVVQAETRELAFLEKGRIEAGTTDQWRNEMLYIPPIPPTNLRGCHLIRIQYDVYFIISPKGPGKEIRLQLPIMMATYPIRNSDGTLQRKKGTHYPTVLPVFRPWLNTDKFKT